MLLFVYPIQRVTDIERMPSATTGKEGPPCMAQTGRWKSVECGAGGRVLAPHSGRL